MNLATPPVCLVWTWTEFKAELRRHILDIDMRAFEKIIYQPTVLFTFTDGSFVTQCSKLEHFDWTTVVTGGNPRPSWHPGAGSPSPQASVHHYYSWTITAHVDEATVTDSGSVQQIIRTTFRTKGEHAARPVSFALILRGHSALWVRALRLVRRKWKRGVHILLAWAVQVPASSFCRQIQTVTTQEHYQYQHHVHFIGTCWFLVLITIIVPTTQTKWDIFSVEHHISLRSIIKSPHVISMFDIWIMNQHLSIRSDPY